MKESRNRMIAILSLSMAGALVGTGISPALNSIRQYFSDADPILIQMVVSLPSLMVLVVAMVFSQISSRFSMRNICMVSLLLFTVGGMAGYWADNIWVLIMTRVIVGIGYGLMMPMSIGLLSYFYEKDQQQKLNGYQVVASSVVSILFMVVVGYIASLSWRGCFLTYSFGLPCLWYNWKYIPDITLDSPKNRISFGLIRRVWPFVIGMFSIMLIYFGLLNNCSSIMIQEGTVDPASVGLLLSFQTLSSLVTGIFLERIKQYMGNWVKYMIWGSAVISMAALCIPNSLIGTLIGLIAFGLSLALAVGLFNASASVACHREESLSAMSVMSFSRCLGQFLSPIVISGVQGVVGSDAVRFPYYFSLILACVLFAVFIPVKMAGTR